MTPRAIPSRSVERELATARGLASCVGDEDALSEADAELAGLRGIEEAAELACGLLWMIDERSDKVREAYRALVAALGGPGSPGLKRSIQRAIDAGFEADHPEGATWWAGKKS